jgi:prepilin-type N-terminal cleavage/methylation domain-containing protein
MKLGQKGFTLIEAIIALVLVGILGALFVSYLGTSVQRSGDPVVLAREEADAEVLMERISADYVKLINTSPASALATLYGNDYGLAVTKTYVTFDANGNEVVSGGATSNLKITVTFGGHRLSSVFTRARTTAGDPKVSY